ncbi:MAG: hypothetical protein IPK16_28130 [Anaerolineales bacterium]|nr:hypothetical protein [Anaerolineales bacterium]
MPDLIDPTNPIVQLCAAGMEAESTGRIDDARRCFAQAWAEHTDAYEACIAAHFLARHQETPEATLRWNQLALDHAAAVDDDRVAGFYPSLYLNLGYAHACLGQVAEARRCYAAALARLDVLQDDRYGNIVRAALAERLQELGES